MKQKIRTMKGPTEPISDLDVIFIAVYNLLYEKIEQEPNKGIIISKGNPNQRKVKWTEIMKMAHMLEDFFSFRYSRTGGRECELCEHWKSVSLASPHMGYCKKKNKNLIHRFHSCKSFRGGNSNE